MLSDPMSKSPTFSKARHALIGIGVVMLILVASCGQDSGDDDLTPPPAPAMRQKSCGPSSTLLPESGVDADDGTGFGIRLEWDMEEEPEDLAGFHVYRATHPDSQFQLLDLDAERFLEGRPAWYLHVDRDSLLRPSSWWGPRVWYFVRSLDRAGNQSTPSDTVSYRLWARPVILGSWVQVSAEDLQVRWDYEFRHSFAFGFRGFQILIATQSDGVLRWSMEVREELLMNWVLPRDLLGLPPGEYKLRVDTLIDVVPDLDPVGVAIRSNPDNCSLAGSESNWISFTF